MNKKLLVELLQEESYHPNEDGVIEIVKRELSGMGFSFFVDEMGNVAAVRGEAEKYPLLNAHMDIVSMSCFPRRHHYYLDYDYTLGHEIDYLIEELGPEILKHVVDCTSCMYWPDCKKEVPDISPEDVCPTFYPTLEGEQFILQWAEKHKLLEPLSPKTKYRIEDKNGKIKGKGQYRVLGGDDKCGIFIALEVARSTDIPMKLLFTVGEELGCLGIEHFVKKYPDWFKNVRYSITIDRKEGDNLLWKQLGVQSCTRKFAAQLATAGIMEGIPVKLMDGNVADVVHIRDVVKNAVNISAGYYNAHSTDEYILWSDVVKIHKWIKRFVTSY